MKKIAFSLLILSLVACKSDSEVNSGGGAVVQEDNKPAEDTGEVTQIETLFDLEKFDNPVHFDLLNELNMCDSVPVEGSHTALCSPEHFRIFPFRDNAKIENSFLLQIRAMTVLKGQHSPLPTRHLIVFERENGVLVKVNGFRGNLIAQRENSSGIKDLVVRFYIPEDQAFMNCLFNWNKEEKQYQFISVEVIEGEDWGGPVKAALKDSVSVEVYKTLMSNAMLF